MNDGRTGIEANIKQGDLALAQWLSFSVNKIHGLRRSNEDKQRAVEGTLTHPNGAGKSDSLIAEHCEVSQRMVSEWRKNLEAGKKISHVTSRTGRDGKTCDTTKQQKTN